MKLINSVPWPTDKCWWEITKDNHSKWKYKYKINKNRIELLKNFNTSNGTFFCYWIRAKTSDQERFFHLLSLWQIRVLGWWIIKFQTISISVYLFLCLRYKSLQIWKLPEPFMLDLLIKYTIRISLKANRFSEFAEEFLTRKLLLNFGWIALNIVICNKLHCSVILANMYNHSLFRSQKKEFFHNVLKYILSKIDEIESHVYHKQCCFKYVFIPLPKKW